MKMYSSGGSAPKKTEISDEERKRRMEFALGVGKLVRSAYGTDPGAGIEAGAELVGNVLARRQKEKRARKLRGAE